MKVFVIFLVILSSSPIVNAELVKKVVEYKHDDLELQGYLVYDAAWQGKRPAVLIGHEWTGIQDYERRRAEEIAQLGYVAFALDVYGKDVRPETADAAAKESAKYKENRELLRARALAGLDEVRKLELVDPTRVAAIGYCFGGMTALELARSGALVVGVVSFHGTLSNPHPEDAKNMKGKVLICHGANDPYVPADEVAAFQAELRKAKVDWQFISYGGVVHSFTNPLAGDDPSKGAAYNELADKRSWTAMVQFFKEIFGE